MSLGVTIVVIVVLAAILIGVLSLFMSRPANLRPHRRRGGRAAARTKPRGASDEPAGAEPPRARTS